MLVQSEWSAPVAYDSDGGCVGSVRELPGALHLTLPASMLRRTETEALPLHAQEGPSVAKGTPSGTG